MALAEVGCFLTTLYFVDDNMICQMMHLTFMFKYNLYELLSTLAAISFRKVIQKLQKIHSINLKKELGEIPALPALYEQTSRLQKILMSEIAKAVDVDERYVMFEPLS